MTDCTPEQLVLQGIGRRCLVARFDGGRISSEGGLPLLGLLERHRGILARFSSCFEDYRTPSAVEHSVSSLVAQRVLALALGHEDLLDHDELRSDPILAAVVGQSDVLGTGRRHLRDRGKPLAGKSTLHRLEWGALEQAAEDRYRRIAVDPEAVDRFFVEVFLDRFESAPAQITLDLDATDDPVHGGQEGRFFHGYYGCYCYLPLYILSYGQILCMAVQAAILSARIPSTNLTSRTTSARCLYPRSRRHRFCAL